MCGIFGLMTIEPESVGADLRRRFASMSRVLQKRGPDGTWTVEGRGSMLGMHRLALRNHEAPSSPIRVGSQVCSYNGEVYSTVRGSEVVPLLEGGVEEVRAILSDASEWRPDGMFALAAWNESNDELRLWRDDLGIKPLFTGIVNDAFVYASELKGVVATMDDAELEPDAFIDMFCFGWPLPGTTVLRGIREVAPSERMAVRREGHELSVRRSVAPADDSIDRRAAFGDFRERLRDSIRLCLLGKESIGIALSGGLDSTILAYELNDMRVRDLSTFSVVLSGQGDGISSLAQLGFEAGGAWENWRHHPIAFAEEEFLPYLGSAMDTLCHPTSMSSIALYQKLAEEVAHAGLRVLLVGEGVDELFFGYESYRRFRDDKSSLESYYIGEDSALLNGLFGSDRVESRVAELIKRYGMTNDSLSDLRRSQLDLRLSRLLYRTDVLLMGVGVEGRTPFLHRGIPDLAMGMSPSALFDSVTKRWLRDQYRGLLPSVDEKKRRFKLSDAFLRRVLLGDASMTLLRQPSEAIDALMAPDARKALIDDYEAGRHQRADLIFTLLTTQLFLRRCEQLTSSEKDERRFA